MADQKTGDLTIPRSLTSDEVAYFAAVEDFCRVRVDAPVNRRENAGACMVILRAFTPAVGRQLDPDVLIAKAEALEEAVDDLPAWTLLAAKRMWSRGAAPASVQNPRYDFPPSPAHLRACAQDAISSMRYQMRQAQRFLGALVEKRRTDAERAEMLRRMKDLPALIKTTNAAEMPPGGAETGSGA